MINLFINERILYNLPLACVCIILYINIYGHTFPIISNLTPFPLFDRLFQVVILFMAAKRLREEIDQEKNMSEKKRLRASPSFHTVVKEVQMHRSFQNIIGAIEPLIRRVIREEIGRVLHRTLSFQRSQIQNEESSETSSTLRLVFSKPPSLPIFTGSKIEDSENNTLRVLLIDTRNGENSLVKLPFPLKLQVVVLDGDFLSDGNDSWTSTEFNRKIVKERNGKRPLLTGCFPVVLRDGCASIGEFNFTDNSSWIRSHHFRIGVKVVQDGYEGPRIWEAVTEPFRVKDHRGELYKKHFPPALTDEVWRLERIGKEGVFHSRLSTNGINTVHDFLLLLSVNPTKLKEILGMSDKMWEGTTDHARTCPIGERLYVHRRQNYIVCFNAICEVVSVHIDGFALSLEELNRSQKAYVQEMVHEAHTNWDNLEEFNGVASVNTAILQDQQVSPWYTGSNIQVDDFYEAESNLTAVFWRHHYDL